MDKTKTTYIKDISELKNGVRQQDGFDIPWTLWLVTDAENDRYTTFEPMLLGKAMENGTEVEITFTEEDSGKQSKTGKPLMNRSITGVKVAQSIPAEFEKRLARIEAALKANGMLE